MRAYIYGPGGVLIRLHMCCAFPAQLDLSHPHNRADTTWSHANPRCTSTSGGGPLNCVKGTLPTY